MSYITAIETAVPLYAHSQESFVRFLSNATNDDAVKRKINIIAKKTGIQERYSVLKDYSSAPEDFIFYAKNKHLEPQPSLSERMTVFREGALPLSLQAVKKIKKIDEIKKQISHVITVTCTGLFAPGLDVDLIHTLNLNPDISRIGINFMGCNAAILALKHADAICKSNSDALVLIVCTELCTLHFQKKYTDDYILSNLLFGDGAAAVLVSGKKPENHSDKMLQIQTFNSHLVKKGYADMAWQTSESGFLMNLTSYVALLIKENIKGVFENLHINPENIKHWAVHPGGKKIIDDFFTALNLENEKAKHSYEVLKKYGNMSSPTVLFVLKEMLQQNTGANAGETVFAAAFGPGLSIETMQAVYA
ncbi:MAG: type III polyketide synthase [Bacteroidetes bacterium]|nr:type III polyketide synthase [Bacteroidota bacterium]